MKNPSTIVVAFALSFLSLCLPAATVTEVQVPSAGMNKTVPCSVVLPDAYGKEPGRRFPVVYMLHGAGGNNRKAENPVICELVDRYGEPPQGTLNLIAVALLPW